VSIPSLLQITPEFFRLYLSLSPFTFYLSPVAAFAAALPRAAAAETAAKPPVSRHPLRLHPLGNTRFPPLSRRFPPAYPATFTAAGTGNTAFALVVG
jgi:hypothetical protein